MSLLDELRAIAAPLQKPDSRAAEEARPQPITPSFIPEPAQAGGNPNYLSLPDLRRLNKRAATDGTASSAGDVKFPLSQIETRVENEHNQTGISRFYAAFQTQPPGAGTDTCVALINPNPQQALVLESFSLAMPSDTGVIVSGSPVLGLAGFYKLGFFAQPLPFVPNLFHNDYRLGDVVPFGSGILCQITRIAGELNLTRTVSAVRGVVQTLLVVPSFKPIIIPPIKLDSSKQLPADSIFFAFSVLTQTVLADTAFVNVNVRGYYAPLETGQ